MDVYDAIFGTDLELVGSCEIPCVSSAVGRIKWVHNHTWFIYIPNLTFRLFSF